MSEYPLTVSSPDGDLLKAPAVFLSVRGAGGDLAVLAGHIPFVTTLRPGDLRVELADGTTRTGHAQSGLLSVSADGVTLLSADLTFDKE